MLAAKHRLRRPAQFSELFSGGRSVSGRHLTIRMLGGQPGPSQFGFVVGKRVSQKAVDRNRTRRRLRAAVAERVDDVGPGYRVAVIAKAGASGAPAETLTSELAKLFKQAKLGRS